LAFAVVLDGQCTSSRAGYGGGKGNRVTSRERDSGKVKGISREELVPSVKLHGGSSDTEVDTSLQDSSFTGIAVDTDPSSGALLGASASRLGGRDGECSSDALVGRGASNQDGASPVGAELLMGGVRNVADDLARDEVHGLALATDTSTGPTGGHALFAGRKSKDCRSKESLDEECSGKHCGAESVKWCRASCWRMKEQLGWLLYLSSERAAMSAFYLSTRYHDDATHATKSAEDSSFQCRRRNNMAVNQDMTLAPTNRWGDLVTDGDIVIADSVKALKFPT
jgi:hypothetical protein